MNAAVEADKYVEQADRLIEVERKAWEAAYGESAPHPRLEIAVNLVKKAKTFVKRIGDAKSELVELSRDHRKAYSEVVAEEEKKFEGKPWKYNKMRSDVSYRKKVSEKAKQKSQQEVNDRLLETCPPRVDRVVYTAEQRKNDIVKDTEGVEQLLQEVAAILKRKRRRRGKDVGYRFSEKKTAFKPKAVAAEVTREGVMTRSMSRTPGMSRMSRMSRIPEASTTTPGRSMTMSMSRTSTTSRIPEASTTTPGRSMRHGPSTPRLRTTQA